MLPINIFSCGWSESYETTRLALFRATLPGLEKFDNYIYSNDLLMATGRENKIDQKENCIVFAKKINDNVNADDVYTILYDTNSETFLNQINNDSLTDGYENNSFLQSLKKSIKKPFLDYVKIAKNFEYNQSTDGKWENWNVIGNEFDDYNVSIKTVNSIQLDDLIVSESDLFLKKRYAFLALRAAFYDKNKSKVDNLFNNFFIKNNDDKIICQWAKYYYSLMMSNKAEANFYLSQVMVNSNDKCHASIQHYDDRLEIETLQIAKTNTEKGIILSIPLLYNPAPTLDKLTNIAKLIPNNKMFAFLVQREINKIEDWIFSPKYSVYDNENFDISSETESDYQKACKENYIKDLKYLTDFKSLLITILPKTSGQQKDFFNAAIAQLC